MYHLGISAFYHDSAAALVGNSRILGAAQQERFSRKRHDSGFPAEAIRYCLEEANINLSDLTSVSYYENPRLKLQRILSSFASAGPGGIFAFCRVMPEWIRWKAHVATVIGRELRALDIGTPPPVQYGMHHRSHAASAFYPSPFETAAVLCIDSVGEWHTTTIWNGRARDLKLVNSIMYPHSLGLLYSAFTYFCGFKVDSGEYKLMGLAPYGEPRYANKIREHLISLRDDGSFSLNLSYFSFLQGERMIGESFAKLFGRARRTPEEELTQDDCDLAASIQKVTDEAVINLARSAQSMTGEKRLCLAGGVALNCVSNGLLSRSNIFSDIWIQPAAGDAGCALGAALEQAIRHAARRPFVMPDHKDAMCGAFLGPSFNDEDAQAYLDAANIPYHRLSEEEMLQVVADYLADGSVVGWFQGRMEFGPRALGARSIIADPRRVDMQKIMNLKIKFRESFRPFAPAVLHEDANKYFEIRQESPYMLVVSPVLQKWRCNAGDRNLGTINKVRSSLPAITHVDYSARVQTVDKTTNERFFKLLDKFKSKTGCSILINTSFNVRGEPIVCTPQDAYICFMRTNIDILVIGNCILYKIEQPEFEEDIDWRREIALD